MLTRSDNALIVLVDVVCRQSPSQPISEQTTTNDGVALISSSALIVDDDCVHLSAWTGLRLPRRSQFRHSTSTDRTGVMPSLTSNGETGRHLSNGYQQGLRPTAWYRCQRRAVHRMPTLIRASGRQLDHRHQHRHTLTSSVPALSSVTVKVSTPIESGSTALVKRDQDAGTVACGTSSSESSPKKPVTDCSS